MKSQSLVKEDTMRLAIQPELPFILPQIRDNSTSARKTQPSLSQVHNL